MKNYILSILLFLFFYSISFAQETACTYLADIGTEIGLDAPGFDADVINFQYDGGTCASINYNGQEIDGSSSFNIDVNVGIGADQIVCGLVDGEPPSPLDFVTFDPTFKCEFNIMDVTGFIEAYAITGSPDATIEKVVNGTVNRTDMIQVYSSIATTLELPLRVSAGLTVIQTFCDPEHSVAEAKASLMASLGANAVNLTGVARVEGGFLDNTNPSVSQTISISVPAGVSTFAMRLEGELSVRSAVRGVSPLGIIACGSNAVAIADNIKVGNFTGLNGTPLPEGLNIIGLDSGIDYVNPMEPLSCLNIPAPEIVVQDDNCGSGTGSATITPIDTLTYEWSNGTIGAQASDLSYGTHFVNVSDVAGCSRDFYVFVDDPEAPEAMLPIYTPIYEQDIVSLIPVDTSDNTLTYLWSTGETTSTIQVSDPGLYAVSVTTLEGCEYTYQTEVYYIETCFDFANEIIDYIQGGGSQNINTNPLLMLGETDSYSISLGDEGIIYAGFCDNLMINSGSPSPDLTIFEVGFGEGSLIELKPFDDITENHFIQSGLDDINGDGYYFIQEVGGGTTHIDIDNIVVGYERESLRFNAIKITDLPGAIGPIDNPGADIDAVSFLSSQCNGDTTNYCLGISCELQIGNENIECMDDGSYFVHIPITGALDSTLYTVFDQANYFNEIDTMQFIDDVSIDTITMGPYLFGRDYQIEINGGLGLSNCNFIIADTASCSFNESCNLSATFSDECVDDSLVISGTIVGGTGPYSIHSDIYSIVIFPDEGGTFKFTVPDCSAQSIDFTITDFTMCQYTESIIVEFPVNGSSCLESITLHPNPVNSILNISFSELCDDSNVKIYNSLGQLIRSDVLTDSSASYDVSTLPKGVYFLYLDNEEDGYVEKFIKI